MIESILLGVVLLVPIVWALMVLSDVHRAALASTAAAREAGFDAVRSTDLTTAGAAVNEAAGVAFGNHGIAIADAEVTWEAPDGLERGTTVEVSVAYPVRVIRVPFMDVGGPSLWVRSTHVARVDPFASR